MRLLGAVAVVVACWGVRWFEVDYEKEVIRERKRREGSSGGGEVG